MSFVIIIVIRDWESVKLEYWIMIIFIFFFNNDLLEILST